MRIIILAALTTLTLTGCDRISSDRIAATCAREFGGDQGDIFACKERRTSDREVRLAQRDMQLAQNEARRP